MNPYLVFGLLSIVLGGIPFILLYSGAGWNPYVAWLSAWSVSAFVIYLIDKMLSKAGALRAPELVLNLLANLEALISIPHYFDNSLLSM